MENCKKTLLDWKTQAPQKPEKMTTEISQETQKIICDCGGGNILFMKKRNDILEKYKLSFYK